MVSTVQTPAQAKWGIHYLAPSLPASAPKCLPSGREGADDVQSTGRYETAVTPGVVGWRRHVARRATK